MIKTVKVGFTGQSKAVTASAKVEYTGEEAEMPSNEDIMKENVVLFEEADKYAKAKTLEKQR